MSKNDITILGLLVECPMHGYQIHQEIKQREMDFWAKINSASIYTTLNRLEERGLIASEKEKVGNMPERNVYTITSSGRETLHKLVLRFLGEDHRPEWLFGLGVAFIRGAPPKEVLAVLKKRQAKLEQCLVDLTDHLTTLKDQIPFNWYMLIENGYKHMQLELDWLRELQATVARLDHWPELAGEQTAALDADSK